MRCMIVDIGSNTVKYDLFSFKNGRMKIEDRRSEALRLVAQIEDGALTAAGMEALCATLNGFLEVAKAQSCPAVYAFATAGMRRLRDPQRALTEIKARTGLTVRLLSGEEEAACSFEGMLHTLKKPPKRGVMLDMGGGSTELNFFEDKRSLWLCSCPFGAVSTKNALRLGETLSENEKEKVNAFARSFLPPEATDFAPQSKTAVLVGGTAKAIAKLAKEFLGLETPEKLKIDEFLRLRELLCAPSAAQSARVRELCPDRYALMATGACAFAALFAALGTKKVRICRGGIREGYLARICREKEENHG